ncbi:hypothetical protein [Ectobacillus panaciterrae]|uniref:hypothetical protein n=1 Tax=Ectobacillus panaciterrae TaxID=363872 RepID=UPI0012DD0D86|nr:hypothetical protein [Ectobacillus panaciterrae]
MRFDETKERINLVNMLRKGSALSNADMKIATRASSHLEDRVLYTQIKRDVESRRNVQ